MIVKVGDKFQVRSESGKSMGTYSSRARAEKRLKQVEMFKHMREKKSGSPINEALNNSKLARLHRELEVEMRSKYSGNKVNPEDVRDFSIALQAIEEIAGNRRLVDGSASGLKGGKYPVMLRAKELALRAEVLKGRPDVHKIADLYMTVKGLHKISSDRSTTDTRFSTNSRVNEMTVAGAAGGAPDGTPQGPLVWGDKGAGVMKTSPFGRTGGKDNEDSTSKKSKTKVDIDSKNLNESERSDDLKAMYGDALKPSVEDVQSSAKAEDYVSGELLKLREKKAEAGRRANFIIDSLRSKPVLESSQPRRIVIVEAKKTESKVNAAGNYTKPGMRKRLFKKIMAGTKGGDPGEWSARKAQMLAREYKKAGGGYKD